MKEREATTYYIVNEKIENLILNLRIWIWELWRCYTNLDVILIMNITSDNTPIKLSIASDDE